MGSPACPDLLMSAVTALLKVDVATFPTTPIFQRRRLRL